MRTADEYRAKLKEMRKNVYLGGDLVERDDPRLLPGMTVVASTFDAVNDPAMKDVITATSHLTGKTINRFTHIHQSSDDLLKKQDMTRRLAGKCGGCIQRCMGVDALNALSVVTYNTDQAMGTHYFDNFTKYLEWYQENDLVANCAQTDVKGDRSKRPHEQEDPDLYLRLVEKNADGIVVNGAKAHNSIAPYADEIIVVPTRMMTEKDADWAVSFAVPADAPGVTQIVRASSHRQRKHLPAPYTDFGMADSLTVFDHVFVPWERVFMAGEWFFAGHLAGLFATYHRHSYTGCKPATSDVMMGAAALVSEYNGIERAPHVRERISDLIVTGELVYAAGVAASVKSEKAASGTEIPNILYTNVGRYHAGVKLYHEFETVAELAGGLPATLPYEDAFFSEELGEYLRKYMMRKPGISPDDQHKLFRYLSDVLTSSLSGVAQVGGLHGGGSPIMEQIAITGQYNLEPKKKLVRWLAGIDGDQPK